VVQEFFVVVLFYFNISYSWQCVRQWGQITKDCFLRVCLHVMYVFGLKCATSYLFGLYQQKRKVTVMLENHKKTDM